jgi:hypothetical protein
MREVYSQDQQNNMSLFVPRSTDREQMKVMAKAEQLPGSTLIHSQKSESLTVSICGSYHRHLKKMDKLIKECKKLGIEVRIPKYAVKKASTNGFVYLKGEVGTPKQLQEKNFDAIGNSSFVLVVNTNGYIGPSTSMEIGYAIAKGIPIFCTEEPEDFVFKLYTDYGKKLEEIKEMLLHG